MNEANPYNKKVYQKFEIVKGDPKELNFSPVMNNFSFEIPKPMDCSKIIIPQNQKTFDINVKTDLK